MPLEGESKQQTFNDISKHDISNKKVKSNCSGALLQRDTHQTFSSLDQHTFSLLLSPISTRVTKYIYKYRISFLETSKISLVVLPDPGSSSTNMYWVPVMCQTLNNGKISFSKNAVISLNSWFSFLASWLDTVTINYGFSLTTPRWSPMISFTNLKTTYWFLALCKAISGSNWNAPVSCIKIWNEGQLYK